jgi:hypothetical protein
MHLLALIMLIGQTSLADSVKQAFREYERRLNAGEYAEPRVTIVDPGVALLTTSYTGTFGTTKFSGVMTITLIRTPRGWRFLAGQS